jgi:ribonuclease HI
MPKNRIQNYANAEDAAEATNNTRKHSEYRVDLFMKGTGNVKSSRGFGAVIHISRMSDTPQMRRLIFRGGVNGESLPAASFRGVVECMDLLAALGLAGASVILHTDNPNVLQAVQGLAYRWRERGWKSADGSKTQNSEMISRMLDHMDNNFTLEAIYKLPERCQELRIAETISLSGHATNEADRLEEVTQVSMVALAA